MLHPRNPPFTRTQKLKSLSSLSIAFDDALQTIRVTGKPLHFRDRHFPAPTELIVGRAPPDVILTRRRTGEQNIDVPGVDGAWDCLKDPMECKDHLVEKLAADIDSPEEHISFKSEENEPHKKYWPPE